MMRKLDNRGAASWEFILSFLPLFLLIFVISDVGRYAIIVQSLHALADAEARQIAISTCYTNDVVSNLSPSSCATTGNGLAAPQQKAVAPIAYNSGATLSVATAAHSFTVTASATFSPSVPWFWGGSTLTPSASATIPF